MERLKFRVFVLGACLLVAGGAIQAMPRPDLHSKDATFMEEKAPRAVGKFKYERNPNAESPLKKGEFHDCSYMVDKNTYDLLQPFGVVGRIYSDGSKAYDVLLISGNDKNCFHDNRVCFSGQGFTITKQSDEILDTPRGDIPITFLELQHKINGKMMAAMFYKGPKNKWYPLPAPLTLAMFFEQLKLSTDLDSTFYRIIPQHPNPDKEEFKQFIRDYVVAAEKSSGGFF